MSCKTYRKRFVEALYDELSSDEKKAFQAHLNTCPGCAQAYAQLASTLQVMDRRQRPEPEEVFWTGYWDRLRDRMDAQESAPQQEAWWKRWIPGMAPAPRWAFRAAAAAALIVLGVFIGKLTFTPSSPRARNVVHKGRPSAEFAALRSRTDQYLERSKVLLLGLINLDTDSEETSGLSLQKHREVSQNLVQEAGFLKQGLSDARAEQRLIELVGDLEVILLQIANLEEENDLSTVEMVRSGVDRKGVLFKINLEEMRRSEKDREIEEKEPATSI